jgi:tRNA A-37 threonylcarbamoyl transferase component Bud32/TolB-like protein
MTPDSRRDLSGTKLHGYLIERLIGKGGMGEVYEAYEESLDRKVALKILPEHLSADESFSARFLREARSAAKLEHPGICPIYAGGEAQGTYFIAMQYVEGETLGEVLEDYGSLPVEQALLVVRRVADALGFAHGRGFVHRDIKPDNIMIDREGRVKVMDFGLARRTTLDTRMTQTGMYVGTPEYSSPEQCETLDLDGRTDIYSLGIVLYEMLSGTVPYKAETPYALFTKICTETPRPVQELNPKLPDNIAAVVDRMIAKDRDERYQSTDDLVRDIDAALRTLDIDSTAETAAVPVPGLASYTTEKIDERAQAVTKRAPYEYKRKKKLAPVLAVLVAVGVIGLWLALALTSDKKAPDDRTADIPDAQAQEKVEPATQPEQAQTPQEHPGDVIPEPVKQTVIDRLNPPREMTGPKEGLPVARLLVCDFVNRNDNPEIDWMRIGVADMFVTDLTQARFLQVVSREELTRLLSRLGITREKAQQDLSVVVKELRADLILKGGIVKIGPCIRIDVQLLDASTGKLLLGDTTQEREENFLGAIDRLSVSLRTSITEVVRRSFPEAPEDIFAGSGDKTLEEQIFLADASAAMKDLKKSAELASLKREQMSELGRKAEESREGGWTAAGAPSPGKSKESESADKNAKGDSRDRRRVGKFAGEPDGEEAEGAAEGSAADRPAQGAASHGQEKKQAARGGGGLSEKAKAKPGAAAQSPGKPEKTRELSKGALPDAGQAFGEEDESESLDKKPQSPKAEEPSPARRKFLAMQLYYKALSRLEGDSSSPDTLKLVAGHLQEALDNNPGFSLARRLLDDVKKRLEGAGK